MKYKILVSDPLSDEGLKILQAEKELEVDVKTGLLPEELKKIIKDYDALIVRSSTKVNKELIDAGKKLKVIGRAGVGLDNVDADAASARGIIVMNTPGGNTISTCEHTLSMMLALSRNIPQANQSLKSGEWDRKRFMGVELLGKTLGIIGLGRIGAEVSRRAVAFGMKVIAYDPFLMVERAKQIGVEVVELDELLRVSDYISVHVPLTDDTYHLIDKKAFKLMKKGVRIINCARGGIIDEDALIDAIKQGRVGGTALDVFENEPPKKENQLLKLSNVVVTPHLGAATEEAQVNVAIEIARQVSDALLARGVRNAVNIPSVEPEVLKIIEPYINLAERMGSLEAQLAEGRIKEVEIRYSGDITNYATPPITVALLKGLLGAALNENVNYVNASFLAKERGIKVVESKSAQVEEFANLISVDVKTDKEMSSVSGTLFTRKDPRIVRIGKFHVDAIPQGYMVVIYNVDKPGIVGAIGTILARNKVNIAGMTFGGEKPGGNAITGVNVDSVVPEPVLAEMRRSKNIKAAKLIKL